MLAFNALDAVTAFAAIEAEVALAVLVANDALAAFAALKEKDEVAPNEAVVALLAHDEVPNKDPVNPWVAVTDPVTIELARAIIPFLATNSFGIRFVF